MKMTNATYRVQFIDEEGEFAFTDPLNLEGAIARACGMRLRFHRPGDRRQCDRRPRRGC